MSLYRQFDYRNCRLLFCNLLNRNHLALEAVEVLLLLIVDHAIERLGALSVSEYFISFKARHSESFSVIQLLRSWCETDVHTIEAIDFKRVAILLSMRHSRRRCCRPTMTTTNPRNL